MGRLRRLILLSLLAASGCTAEGERYNPTKASAPGSEGVIYVYRPVDTFLNRGESPFIQIDGRGYGLLKAGGYMRAVLPEGEHRVTIRQTIFLIIPTIPKSVTVAVVPGSRSYVKVDQRITGFGLHGGATATQETSIEEVSVETGQAEIAGMRAN
jgi:hypothetical protein